MMIMKSSNFIKFDILFIWNQKLELGVKSVNTPRTEWFLVSRKKPKKLAIHEVPLWSVDYRKNSH